MQKKLERYGIALEWFKSYLSNRIIPAKCSILEGTTYSDTYPIQYIAQQGSCPGPLLFLIFTNDLYLHLHYCKCILFADDTTLYQSHKNRNYIEWCLHKDLKVPQDWFRAKKLTLNISKTQCMQFGNNIKHEI